MNTQATVSQPATVPGSSLMQVSGALLGVIVLILMAAWAIRRLELAPRSASTHGPKVTVSTLLDPCKRVIIVEAEDARLVPSVTASQINILHIPLPASADTEEKTAPPADFQAMMKSLLKRPGRP